ncbi:MAG: hypothetical protein EOO00_12815, partial [Chitinophagaceae bacterium]
MGKTFNDTITTVLLIVLITGLQACIKEYSAEGGPVIPVQDTLTQPPVIPGNDTTICPECTGKDQFEENRWSFWESNSFLCGVIDTAIVGADRDVFTFFGLSSCSSDTNLVISVFLDNEKLDRDRQDLVIPKVVFYVSINAGSVYWLQTRPGTPFNMTIYSYDHQTRMTTGTFSGIVYKPDGAAVQVKGTKFKV